MVYGTKMKNKFILVVMFIVISAKYVECGKKMDLDELKEQMKPMSKTCKTKTGVTDELIQGTKRGEFPRERPLMCYFKCLSVMLKVMNKQGEVTLPAVYKQLDLFVKEDIIPKLKVVVEKCLAEVQPSEDICEYAFDLTVCCYDTDSSVFFLP